MVAASSKAHARNASTTICKIAAYVVLGFDGVVVCVHETNDAIVVHDSLTRNVRPKDPEAHEVFW